MFIIYYLNKFKFVIFNFIKNFLKIFNFNFGNTVNNKSMCKSKTIFQKKSLKIFWNILN